MTLTVHVEQLVLDGIDLSPGGGVPLRLALQAELARLLASGGLPSSLHRGAALESLPGDNVTFEAAEKPSSMGRSIAHAVNGGLRR